MPLTPAQEKAVFDNLMSWGDLDEDTQKRIAVRAKQEIIDMLREFEPIHLPTEYVKPALAAAEQAENDCVPWFYLEILLGTTMDSGETVEQYIDRQVEQYCNESVYCLTDQLTFGLEVI